MILAIYIRLSSEDSDIKSSKDKTESNSVANQRKLLMDYYKRHPELQQYTILEFCDDGYTGTNFNRPKFILMMEMVRRREINCIMVKDLSRFGREYLEVGGYLELILPLFGTRFISVNDAFDSNNYIGTTGGLELALRNLIHGMYSKDLSVKVRSAVKTRNRRGEYWGGNAFYGYLLDPKDGHKIIINEDVRPVVTMIYDLCIDGLSTRQIAQRLNEMGIPSPAEYKKHNGMVYNGTILEEKSIWLSSSVRKILTDERYTGKMITGTRETVGVHTNKMRPLPKEEWIIVKDTHEAIITEDKFHLAAEALKSRIKTVNANTSGNRAENLFVCGYCGRKLQKSNGKRVHLYCIKSRSHKGTECESLHEDIEVLQKNTLTLVRFLANALLQKAAFIKRTGGSTQELLRREIAMMDNRIQKIRNGKSALYEEYRAGKITRERFVYIQSENQAECEKLEAQLSEKKGELEKWKQGCEDLKKAAKDAEEIQLLSEYRSEVIRQLIECIRVFPEGRIEICLKNKDFLEEHWLDQNVIQLEKIKQIGDRNHEQEKNASASCSVYPCGQRIAT
jgi:DNA invertase Pin-like site-specific DNA recombinase